MRWAVCGRPRLLTDPLLVEFGQKREASKMRIKPKTKWLLPNQVMDIVVDQLTWNFGCSPIEVGSRLTKFGNTKYLCCNRKLSAGYQIRHPLYQIKFRLFKGHFPQFSMHFFNKKRLRRLACQLKQLGKVITLERCISRHVSSVYRWLIWQEISRDVHYLQPRTCFSQVLKVLKCHGALIFDFSLLKSCPSSHFHSII